MLDHAATLSMSILRTALPVLAALIALSSCSVVGRPPASAQAARVTTRFCGFVLDGRTKQARFTLDLAIDPPFPPGTTLEVTFENPLAREKPVVVTRELAANERELRVVSTPVKGIARREYAMLVRVYASPDKSLLLATHTESCRAPFDQGDFGVEFR